MFNDIDFFDMLMDYNFSKDEFYSLLMSNDEFNNINPSLEGVILICAYFRAMEGGTI